LRMTHAPVRAPRMKAIRIRPTRAPKIVISVGNRILRPMLSRSLLVIGSFITNYLWDPRKKKVPCRAKMAS
jgi:hypothetical protein